MSVCPRKYEIFFLLISCKCSVDHEPKHNLWLWSHDHKHLCFIWTPCLKCIFFIVVYIIIFFNMAKIRFQWEPFTVLGGQYLWFHFYLTCSWSQQIHEKILTRMRRKSKISNNRFLWNNGCYFCRDVNDYYWFSLNNELFSKLLIHFLLTDSFFN